MSPSASSRTAACNRRDAEQRLIHAQKFLEVATLAASDTRPEGYGSVVASLAVLAGIATADAAACFALGVRSRSRDHRDAVSLVAQVSPGGGEAANALRRLIDLKDTAHYGVVHVSAGQVKTALRQAQGLVDFAVRLMRGL